MNYEDIMKNIQFEILGAVLIIVLVIFFTYRNIQLKKYRKELVLLENKFHALKSLPIQYRLGRMQGIANNIPEIMPRYERYAADYEVIAAYQSDVLALQLSVLDEQLYANRIKGMKKAMLDLRLNIESNESNARKLLTEIEKVTEIENMQRLAIIKIKELYRKTQDMYAAVRFSVEDFVPQVTAVIKSIEADFVTLEDLMNDQKYQEVKQQRTMIETAIATLRKSLDALPNFVSIVRKYIPKQMKELQSNMAEMEKLGFNLEVIHASLRFQKIEHELQETIEDIKNIHLDPVEEKIQILHEDIRSLSEDLAREKEALEAFTKKQEQCFQHIDSLHMALQKAIVSIDELKANYKMDFYTTNMTAVYQDFQEITDEMQEMQKIIDSHNFSYHEMIHSFDALLEKCIRFEDIIQEFTEMRSSLLLQEKRALDELDNINIVLLEIKSEIKNKHLPMINDSYKDYIVDSYDKAAAIVKFTRERPVDLKELTLQADGARDVIYKLYDNVHNLVVTAQMVEEAIVYGNRYRSSYVEVNTELTKAELLFRNGEYTKALTIAVDIIEKIKPGSYERLVNDN